MVATQLLRGSVLQGYCWSSLRRVTQHRTYPACKSCTPSLTLTMRRLCSSKATSSGPNNGTYYWFDTRVCILLSYLLRYTWRYWWLEGAARTDGRNVHISSYLASNDNSHVTLFMCNREKCCPSTVLMGNISHGTGIYMSVYYLG